MRRKITILFLILLALQAVQVLTINHSMRKLESAARDVATTVEGREVSRITRTLLDQLRNNIVIIAGMNYPATGLQRFQIAWEGWRQRLNSMQNLAINLSFEPKLLTELKKNIKTTVLKEKNFEKTIIADSPGATYIDRIHNAAFEFDESLESTRAVLDNFFITFLKRENSAAFHEQKIRTITFQVTSAIGFLIGCILIGVGFFAVTKIVDPLIELTIKYRNAMKRLKKEQEVAIMLEKARAMAQAKSDFLSNMSHELRTPMNAVLGFSQLLVDTKLDKKQKNYLNLILSSGRHLIQIINDILDFSKLEAGKIAIEHIDFNLEKMVNEVMKIASSRMPENPLDMYIDYANNVPKNVNSDPTRLKQILVNLLSNAVKFTSYGEVGIIVRLDNQIDHKEGEIPIRITVKDSGIGIPKNKIDMVFASFTQVDESTTRQYGGTGLGLSITHSIVEAMGGRIWVESEEEKGSEFIVSIKVKKGKPVDPWEIDEEAQKILVGKKVFIVDDNEIARKIVKKICETIGMKVLSMADSGPAAFAKLDELAQKNIFPDVILCDIIMAEMYGYIVAKKLRAHKKFKNTNIVAVTKISEADITTYIKDDCFDAYITKPVSRIEMINVLAEVLGYKKAKIKKTSVVRDIDSFAKIKVLVVENSVTNMMFIRECLGKIKCKADYAQNGREAIKKIELKDYDLCLMDLQMPIMGGIEATEIIRKKLNKKLPIIALTAAVLKDDRIKAKEVGINDFIDKPILIEKLEEKILQYGNPKKDKAKPPQKSGKEIKALVVDDDLINMKLFITFLKKLNCQTDSAANGKEAVYKVKNNSYDICFMDIQMPIMDGVEATKIIREEISKTLPIIAVTAVKDFTYEKSLGLEMNDCLNKPVDFATLKKIVPKFCTKA